MSHDAIVVGLGAIGSSACAALARRGRSVLGLDAFEPGHRRGSSHGRSRITRHAYPDGPGYVPLVRRATELWEQLQERAGRRLLHRVGTLAVAPPGHFKIAGGRRSAERFGIPLEPLEGAELAERFPMFRLPDGMAGVYEPGAGYLEPEAGVAAQLDDAAAAGAELRFSEPVLDWAPDGAGVRVTTAGGTVTADRLVVAAGPWTPHVLADLGLPLEVQRRVNVHFEPRDPAALRQMPVFNLVVPEGEFYGFPPLPEQGVKLGRHDADEPCTPETVRRAVGEDEVAAMRAVLERYVPAAAGPAKWSLTCLYTNTPDGRFVLDRHPRHEQVALFAGCSGHAFKFAPVVGEVLADLAVDGTTPHDIGFLSATRFGG